MPNNYVHLVRYTVVDHPGLLRAPFLATYDLRLMTCPKCQELYAKEMADIKNSITITKGK